MAARQLQHYQSAGAKRATQRTLIAERESMIVLTGRASQAEWLAFTADSRRVACSRDPDDGVFEGIEFWDVSSGVRAEAIPPASSTRGFVLHPGGKWAYANFTDRSLVAVHPTPRSYLGIVDLTTGKVSDLQRTVYGRFFPVAASPDGTRVVASVNTQSHVVADWLLCWEHTSTGKRKLGWQRQRKANER